MIERLVFGIVALAIVVLGFFFLAAALLAGALIALVILGRLWWLRRKLERAERESFITTEYTVVERERLEPPLSESQKTGTVSRDTGSK